jgi:hypothetical protein
LETVVLQSSLSKACMTICAQAAALAKQGKQGSHSETDNDNQ